MKRLARWLARLYPRQWRARYGEEFEALLEDATLGWRDCFGVVLSALEIRMETTNFPRIVNLVSRDIPYGYELESSVEYPREDGSKMLVKHFDREIDFGDSYVTLRHWSRGVEPAQTVLVFGAKGEVEGGFRTDQTEMLVLQADGTVRRTEQTVKTSLKHDAIRDRYRSGMAAGLSPDEVHRQIVKEGELAQWS
jgi:hypothetical protein